MSDRGEGAVAELRADFEFVDFDLIDRMVGVSPCHPQARTGFAVPIQTCEQWTPPAVVQGGAPDSDRSAVMCAAF